MNKTKLLTIFSLSIISLLILPTQGQDPGEYFSQDCWVVLMEGNNSGYDYYDYEEGDYEYVYDDDCVDLDGDDYCDEDTNTDYEVEDGEPQFGDDETGVKVDLGNTARLTCTVNNLASQVISWKRGDSFLFLGASPLTNDGRYSVEMTDSSSILTITLVKQEDAGDFKCQVASSPPLEQIFSIEIKGRPGARAGG